MQYTGIGYSMKKLINNSGIITLKTTIEKTTTIPDLRKTLNTFINIISNDKVCQNAFLIKIGSLRTVYKDILYQKMLDDLVEDFELIVEDDTIKEIEFPTTQKPSKKKKFTSSYNMKNYIQPIEGINIEIGDIESNIFLKVKYELIRVVLERNNDNRTNTALELGISIRTLRNYLKDYEKDYPILAESNKKWEKIWKEFLNSITMN